MRLREAKRRRGDKCWFSAAAQRGKQKYCYLFAGVTCLARLCLALATVEGFVVVVVAVAVAVCLGSNLVHLSRVAIQFYVRAAGHQERAGGRLYARLRGRRRNSLATNGSGSADYRLLELQPRV